MKDLIKDFKEENFTLREWLIYGILYPSVVIFLAIVLS